MELFEEHAVDRNGDGKVNVLIKDGSDRGEMGGMPETERAAIMQDPEFKLFIMDTQ